MLIRIIPFVILFAACGTTSKDRIARVTPITAEMEVEYLPAVEVVALHDEVQIEYIPSAE